MSISSISEYLRGAQLHNAQKAYQRSLDQIRLDARRQPGPNAHIGLSIDELGQCVVRFTSTGVRVSNAFGTYLIDDASHVSQEVEIDDAGKARLESVPYAEALKLLTSITKAFTDYYNRGR